MEPVTHTSVRSFFPSFATLNSLFPILSLEVVSPHAPFPVPRSYFSLSALLFHYLLSFSYPLPVYHFTFVFHYLTWLFPFIHPQGRAKNGEQADAAEVVAKETFFFCDPTNFARSIFRVPTFSSFPLTESLEQRDSSNCLTYSCLTYSWIMYEFC